MNSSSHPTRPNGTRSTIRRLIIPLAFIALMTVAVILIFEQISMVFFHHLTIANAHIITVIMVGIVAPLSALLIILRFEGLNRDLLNQISERKRVEKELQDAKSQAECYLDLMCHDINNMNQISMGYLELALGKIETEGALGRNEIDYIRKPFETLKSTAKLIGNVSKLQMEMRGELKLKPIDVGRVLSEIKAQYDHVPGRDVTVHFENTKTCFVEANELVADLYSNIVGNAIKHSAGPLTVDIGLSDRFEGGKKYCEVTIEDNGPGISDDLKRQLIERMTKANIRYTGKGFGLCLVKTLISDFKGKLSIEDRVAGDHTKGARFVITLPAAEK